MCKRFLCGLPLCIAAVASMNAQAELGMADLLRLAGHSVSAPSSGQVARVPMRGAVREADGSVELIVRFDDESALDAMQASGAVIVERLSAHTAVVATKASQAVAVAASSGVRSASLSVPVRKANMSARAASGVDRIHDGDGLQTPFTGKGVVVGIFDTGVDPNHINFMDDEGNSRVRRVWGFSGASSVPSEYGTDTPVSYYRTDNESESHGTHVLGIMAGSFADPADASHDFRGMAPEAEIAVGCGDGYNAQILTTLSRIAKYAREEGKPCVINVSFGDNIGPHDGSDDFSFSINEIAEENDAVICLSAGNERDVPVSFIKELDEDDCELKTLILPSDMLSASGSVYQGIGQVQVWCEDETPVEVSLEIISKTAPATALYSLEIPEGKGSYAVSGTAYMNYLENYARYNILKNETGFTSLYTQSYMGGVRGVDTYNGRYYADLNVYLVCTSQQVANRNYVCLHVKGQPGKKVFVYCDGYYINFGDKRIPGMEKYTGAGSNSNMASGEHTIAVGSYVTANVSGSRYPTDAVIGDISWFSSFGETPDGRVMPDVCAPGQTIISSRNSYASSGVSSYPVHYYYTDRDKKKTYSWTSCAGTSQASPHMAGVAALWLSANPALTHQDVKRIAQETASAPAFSSEGWGYGVLDAYAGLKKVLSEMNSVGNVFDSLPDDGVLLRSIGSGYEIFVPGQERVEASLVSMSGITVRHEAVAGETLTFSTDGIAPGVYLLEVSSPRASRTVKVLVR